MGKTNKVLFHYGKNGLADVYLAPPWLVWLSKPLAVAYSKWTWPEPKRSN